MAKAVLTFDFNLFKYAPVPLDNSLNASLAMKHTRNPFPCSNRKRVPPENWSMADRQKNRRVVIFMVPGTTLMPELPSEPPPDDKKDDTLEKKIARILKLLETRHVDPDATGGRTKRVKCVLRKLLKPVVDGGVSGQTINGVKPGYYDCIIYARNVGYKGMYDKQTAHMPQPEFNKFLSTLKPIINAFVPGQSDNDLLKAVGGVFLRIDEGNEMVDEYLQKQSLLGERFVDGARRKLRRLIRDNMNDENNIYSCYS